MTDDREGSRAVERRIELEHAGVRQRLERIAATTDKAALGLLLGDLAEFLWRHFGNEEAPDGCFELCKRTAPRLGARVDLLGSEHGALLEEVDRVRDEVMAAATVAAVRPALEALSRRLREHERREDELLQQAMVVEIGAGD